MLFRACSDFLTGTLELSNCLMLLALAEGYGSASLLQQANEFVVQNFHDLSMTTDFLDMPVRSHSDKFPLSFIETHKNTFVH